MSRVKQVIVVRRDLRLRRSELSALIAKAASKFFIDADESELGDKMHITLSPSEALWISGGSPSFIVLGVPSSGSMESLLFRADAAGLPVYRVTGTRHVDPDDVKAGFEEQTLVAAIGPEDEQIINQLTGKLKLL